MLLSITEKCELIIKQTHALLQETLDFKLCQSRKTIHFNPLISIERSGLLELISLAVHNSLFLSKYQNNKFEFYTDTFDEISFEELKIGLEGLDNISNFTNEHLQDYEIVPRISSAFKKLQT